MVMLQKWKERLFLDEFEKSETIKLDVSYFTIEDFIISYTCIKT